MADNHGNTPAAWTAVTLGLLAFIVGGAGLMANNMPTFWVGLILAPVALITGVVMSRLGFGSAH